MDRRDLSDMVTIASSSEFNCTPICMFAVSRLQCHDGQLQNGLLQKNQSGFSIVQNFAKHIVAIPTSPGMPPSIYRSKRRRIKRGRRFPTDLW